MKVVATFHQPSSVLSSVKCHLGSKDVEHLIIGKLNRVIVYSIQPHGLQKECSVDIRGKALCLKAVPIPKSHRSNLLLMIAHPDPEIVFFTYTETEDGTGELIVKNQLPLYERAPRPAEFFNDVLVHPSGQLAIVSCYTGKLKIIKIKTGNYQDDFDASLPELNVFSIAFLSTFEAEYAIAILYLDSKGRVQLHARDILLDDFELSARPSVLLHPTPLSDKVVPFPTDIVPRLVSVPAPDPYANEDDDTFRGGVLVIGGRKLLLYELAGREAQEKQRGKLRKLEARKSSSDVNEVARAREKETERENRRRKPKASVEWPWSEVSACCSIDGEPLRFLIGDAYGKLSLLSVDNVNELGLILIPLGETSPPTTLSYLTSQTVYVGSHLGDSQVIEISPTPVSSSKTPTLPIPPGVKTIPQSALISSRSKGKAREETDETTMEVDNESEPTGNGRILATQGSYLSVLESQKNIAPIVDAVLVDVDGTGQRQIITCSGGRSTGSLNIVRHGADFEELAYIPGLLNVTNVWPVKVRLQDAADSHILVSTLEDTLLFRIDDASGKSNLSYVENDTLSGLRIDTPTLSFANVARRVKVGNAPATYENSSLAVQVTPRGVFLLEMDSVIGSYTEVNRWMPEGQGTFGEKQRDIVAASINPSQVLVGLHGGKLVALSIVEKDDLRILGELDDLPEIAAVSCMPLDSRNFTNNFAVSFWGKNTVEIFTPTKGGLTSVCKTDPLPSLVRSLLLCNFGTDASVKGEDYRPYLLAGLSDGSLVTFVWKDKQLKEKKLVSLGHAPTSLAPCMVDGKRTVLAAGNRATLVSFDKKRLQFSPVSLKDISGASRFNSPSFPSSLVLATPTGISIGRVSDLDRLHIRTIPFGLDNPRRIVYEPSTRAFGVACTETIPGRVGEVETTRSSFVLVDDLNFSQMCRFWCDEDEEITSTSSFNFKEEGKDIPLFCVGTYRYIPEEIEPVHGRILVFAMIIPESESAQSSRQLSLLASVSVKGCVYALTTVGDCIAAAVNSSVELYRLDRAEEEPSTRAYRLRHLSSWNHNYIVAHLATFDQYLLIGDQISSISLVKIIDNQLRSVARDYGPLWPVSVDASSETDIIAANDALNLYTFSLSRQPGRTMLERNGNWHLADLVTKFIRGSLSHDIEENTYFAPKELFFTSSGRIGILLDISGTDSRLPIRLTALERNMAYFVEGIGGDSHTRYRAPRSTRGRTDADSSATGFLDGDFLEQFLSLMSSKETVDKIMAGTSDPEKIDVKVEDLQRVVESLQSMH
ncbi:hypothetical protein AX15_000024 [Amanita polypyramis BW_CC]|nr:hypothetical protein AX15_000024 [Amanita polypyramis BW_CC]